MRDLIGCDPCDSVVLQELGLTAHDLSMKQREMNRDVGVLVDDIHESVADGDRHIQLFLTLSDEGFLLRFTGFNLTADVFP